LLSVDDAAARKVSGFVKVVRQQDRWPSGPWPRGVSFVKYDTDRTFVTLVAEVEVNRSTGAIRVTQVWCGHDYGQIVKPDGAINQIEGGIVQTISRPLLKELQVDRTHVISTDCASDPILRFLVVPLWGAGEMASTVVQSAISNAVFDAISVRLRSVPFLPAKVKAACVA
jgi:nicotinate dehydrogenase subunit B